MFTRPRQIATIVLTLALLSAAHASRPEVDIDALREAAAAGDDTAQAELGYNYVTGRGISRDAVTAAHWLRQAAVAGNTRAQHNLAAMYANGDGVAQDMNQAAPCFAILLHGYTEARKRLSSVR